MEETAKILIHDIQFGDRAKEKAIQHGDDIIPLIRKETKDFTVLVRADWIADVLGAIKTESSRKVLLDLYSRTNDLTRLVGAVGLARQGALTGPVDEHSFLVRMAALERSPHNEMAIRALGLSRDEKALPFLVDLLKKGRGARLDGVTCEALAAIGSKDAIPVLRDCLKADKFYALPSAFRALIILGDRDAIPLAIARLTPEDKRSGGARWIVVDLRLMTGEKFGFDQASWLQWWDSAKGSWQIPEKFRKPWDYKDYMGMEAK
jgi:HEAT repeat protein